MADSAPPIAHDVSGTAFVVNLSRARQVETRVLQGTDDRLPIEFVVLRRD